VPPVDMRSLERHTSRSIRFGAARALGSDCWLRVRPRDGNGAYMLTEGFIESNTVVTDQIGVGGCRTKVLLISQYDPDAKPDHQLTASRHPHRRASSSESRIDG
jgi:hypothetical protein